MSRTQDLKAFGARRARSFAAVATMIAAATLLSCDGLRWEPLGVVQASQDSLEFVLVDTTVRQGVPDGNLSEWQFMRVSAAVGGLEYILMNWMPTSTAPPVDAFVQSATLVLHTVGGCWSGAVFEARRIPPGWDWNPATATWNCRSDTDGVAGGCGTGQPADQWVPTEVVGVGRCGDGGPTVSIDLTHDMSQWVASGGTSGSPPHAPDASST